MSQPAHAATTAAKRTILRPRKDGPRGASGRLLSGRCHRCGGPCSQKHVTFCAPCYAVMRRGRIESTCTVCAKTFTHPLRTYPRCCSRVCRQKAMSAPSRCRTRLHICVVCGKAFQKKRGSRNQGLCCSRTCGWRLIHLRGVERRAERQRARAEQGGHQKVCIQCGTLFIAKRGNAKLCSVACRRAKQLLDGFVYSRTKQARCREQSGKMCQECGSALIVGSHRATYCSDACFRQSKRRLRRKNGSNKGCGPHAHRAKCFGGERDWSIKNEAIFIRDGWRCRLCGRVTPKRLRGSCDPKAPEVDHIVPLSRGGGHVWHNVQCACRQCNSRKGAKTRGQLRLAI